jgi:uncharacterized protein YqjF (DUF2071 family)
MPSADYELDCLQPLTGLHLVGTVTRRFLISYPVEPELLASRVPPGAELSLAAGKAWVSACFVHIDDMRPAGTPRALGMQFHYLIHRTRALLPYPDGVRRESVLILEPNIDRSLLSCLGRLSAGVRFEVRDVTLEESSAGWRLRMSRADELLFDAEIPRDFTDVLPAGSRFASAQAADAFLLGVAYGGEWHSDRERLRLLAETHDPWSTLVGTCRTHTNAFLEALGAGGTEADHVITMTDIPHYFAMRGFDVALSGAT